METTNKRIVVLVTVTALLAVSCGKLDLGDYFHGTVPVNDRVKQSLDSNNVNLPREVLVPGSEYNILVAADSHVGGTVNLNTLITEANKTANSALVMVGDLTTGNEADFIKFDQELKSKYIREPFLMTGNHDLFFGGWNSYTKYFGSSTYSFTVTSSDTTDLFICLDSGGGTLGWRQMEWLRNLLEKERMNNRYCIVFTHVNFFREHRTGSTNPLVEELRVMLDLCHSNSIDMVIMGHDHNRSDELFGKTRFLTLDALMDDFANASYLTLKVKQTGLEFSFTDL